MTSHPVLTRACERRRNPGVGLAALRPGRTGWPGGSALPGACRRTGRAGGPGCPGACEPDRAGHGQRRGGHRAAESDETNVRRGVLSVGLYDRALETSGQRHDADHGHAEGDREVVGAVQELVPGFPRMLGQDHVTKGRDAARCL